ncbi:hypothetical protein LMTR3_25615 [Bradyrhizobium sp. LMTR 3]|nr:hypothetical protein LMTR3_25615 [Bradyrhizobium sp. LMTR 3]
MGVAARHRSIRGCRWRGATDTPQILRDVGSGPSRVQGVPVRTTLRQIYLQDSDSAASTRLAAISQHAGSESGAELCCILSGISVGGKF